MNSDLVLPAATESALHALVRSVPHRLATWRDTRFAQTMPNGCGIAALFTGPSGTGKSMAADAVARWLGLPLRRVDMTAITSKYIGETEKNLEEVIAEARDLAAVLLFDEADALFGKRGGVGDAHDRYANVAPGWLLDRIEASNGLAIFEATDADRLDPACVRRLTRVIDFPTPGPAERTAIWHRALPPDIPARDLDLHALGAAELDGRQIVRAAFEAAVAAREEGVPITMDHLARAIAPRR